MVGMARYLCHYTALLGNMPTFNSHVSSWRYAQYVEIHVAPLITDDQSMNIRVWYLKFANQSAILKAFLYCLIHLSQMWMRPFPSLPESTIQGVKPSLGSVTCHQGNQICTTSSVRPSTVVLPPLCARNPRPQ